LLRLEVIYERVKQEAVPRRATQKTIEKIKKKERGPFVNANGEKHKPIRCKKL